MQYPPSTRYLSARFWLGLDQRITSGPAAIAAASQRGKPRRENRPDTWLHPNASQNVRFLLHRGRRPYMAHRVILRQRSKRSLSGAKRTSAESANGDLARSQLAFGNLRHQLVA